MVQRWRRWPAVQSSSMGRIAAASRLKLVAATASADGGRRRHRCSLVRILRTTTRFFCPRGVDFLPGLTSTFSSDKKHRPVDAPLVFGVGGMGGPGDERGGGAHNSGGTKRRPADDSCSPDEETALNFSGERFLHATHALTPRLEALRAQKP